MITRVKKCFCFLELRKGSIVIACLGVVLALILIILFGMELNMHVYIQEALNQHVADSIPNGYFYTLKVVVHRLQQIENIEDIRKLAEGRYNPHLVLGIVVCVIELFLSVSLVFGVIRESYTLVGSWWITNTFVVFSIPVYQIIFISQLTSDPALVSFLTVIYDVILIRE